MKEILDFLRDLEQNNNRQWFADNKERYKQMQARWNKFCEELIAEVGRFDENIASLTVPECTYRIYRDTRFSKDKSPYKTHFGVFMAKGGKKSQHAGYYFHIGTGLDDKYPFAHMVVAGNYCYDNRAVKIIHEDISDDWDDFKINVLDKADTRFVPEMDGALKRVPREYNPEAPYADWMRMKNFGLTTYVDDKFILSDNLVERVAELFKTTKPFVDYINRAVDFVEEEY